jgi:trimeric autotransporter adhesin
MAMLMVAAFAPAQCGLDWQTGDGLPGIDGTVYALHQWDADGAGPTPPVLVVGGAFTIAGDVIANNIARWDPSTGEWQAFGSGFDGAVRALTSRPNGELVAGGDFGNAGGTPAGRIAKWDGTTWSPLGTGIGTGNVRVNALTTMSNGDVIAGGNFTVAGGAVGDRIARWDDNSWSGLSTGCDDTVMALTRLANGNVVAGGLFFTAGGVPTARIAQWDGTTWSPVGFGITLGSQVNAMATLPNGTLVVGGSFSFAGGMSASNIAQWNGTAWSALGSGVNGTVLGLAATANGQVIATGSFTQSNTLILDRIGRWTGTAWAALGSGLFGFSRAVAALPNGDIVAGGDFSKAGGRTASRIARFDGTTWFRLAGGFDARVSAFLPLPNGERIAGGQFSVAGSADANHVARFDGTNWFALGAGMQGVSFLLPTTVTALAALPNGDVIAGGLFGTAGGGVAANIASWNGSTWSPLGSGVDGQVLCLLTLPNGDLIAGGGFVMAGGGPVNNIARWDGSSWSPLGTGMAGGASNNNVNALGLLPNGDVVAVGNFVSAGGVTSNGVARWDGANWHDYAGGITFLLPFLGVQAVTVLPDGDIVVGGLFATVGGVSASNVARWDGSSWTTLGTGVNSVVFALASLPDGSVIAGGSFTQAGTSPAANIARWNGSSWQPFGSGADDAVSTLAVAPSGEVLVGGSFDRPGGLVSVHSATLATTCPASVVDSAMGCAGSGGNNSLAADNLPWTGTTFLATGTGLPALGFIGVVDGFSMTSLPLAALLPGLGQPGCSLLVSPDAVDFLISNAGMVQSTLLIPNNPTLAGAVLHRQLVPFEVDLQLQFVAVTSSNVLTLTIGAF